MEHNITTQVRKLFPASDAEYMSDRLRSAGIVTLFDPKNDAITINRIRINAEEIKASGAEWIPTW